MTPSSDKNQSFDRKSKDALLKAIGNPNASEEEWLAACAKLGEHPQPQKKKLSAPGAVGMCALGAVAVVVCANLVNVGSQIAIFNLSHHSQLPPAAAPEPTPTPNAASEVDFGPYMADLQRRIKRAWYPPKGNESKRVKVRFKQHADGKISDLRLIKSSGVTECDAAALAAVRKANPNGQLPKGAPENVDIEFTFDYNVFQKNQDRFEKSDRDH